MATTEKCSKCDGVLDTTGTPRWCKQCRAAYQKQYQDGIEERAERRGVRHGIEEMRKATMAKFQWLGSAHFSGIEAAAIVHKLEGPSVEGEKGKEV